MQIRVCSVALLFLLTPSAFTIAGEKGPIILNHDGWVAAVAFAPDGETLASAGSDNVVRLWDPVTWKAKGVLKGHADFVVAVDFSKDSRWLATGSFDGTAKLWYIDKRDSIWSSDIRKAANTSVHVVVDARFHGLLTGGVDGIVRLQCPATPLGVEDRVFIQHKSWVNSLAVHKAGLATASSDGTVGLITNGTDGKSAKPIFLEGGAGEVRSVAFSPNGKLLAAGNRYHTVRIWDVATRKEVKTLTGHASDVWAIAFSPDGKTLAAADTDWKKPSRIKLWDTTTWTERASLACPGEILCLAYSPNGDWLAAGSWDRTVRVFSLR